jgi:cell division protein FtsL
VEQKREIESDRKGAINNKKNKMTIYSTNNHKKYFDNNRMPRRVSSFQRQQNPVNHMHGQRGSSVSFFLTGIGILSIIVLAGFMYIFQVTSSAVNGYDTTSLEKQVNKLADEKRQLELESANLQSVRAVAEGAQKLKLIPANKIVYTSPLLGGTVAFSGTQSEI